MQRTSTELSQHQPCATHACRKSHRLTSPPLSAQKLLRPARLPTPGTTSKRNANITTAASPVQQLQQIFSRGSPYKSASRELQSLIQEGSEDTERFSELVNILLDSELPFKESALGNGEWQVVYTRGALLWQQLTSGGSLNQSGRLSYKSKRKAGQEFSPDGRTVINRGDVFSDQLMVSAQGTYELQDTNSNLPKLVKANISGGEVTALGRKVPLPFKGTGFFSIMYVDDAVRVFSDRDKGTVSVQVQADRLQELLA